MEVTDELINKLSTLARLEFNGEEKEQIKVDLQKMITFIEKLNELDTTGVAPLLHMSDNVNVLTSSSLKTFTLSPLLHMSDNVNVLRDDEVKNQVSRKEALLNAPSHNDQFFLVPKVIRK